MAPFSKMEILEDACGWGKRVEKERGDEQVMNPSSGLKGTSETAVGEDVAGDCKGRVGREQGRQNSEWGTDLGTDWDGRSQRGYQVRGEERALETLHGRYEREGDLGKEKGPRQRPGRRTRPGSARVRGPWAEVHPEFRRQRKWEEGAQ